MASMVNNLVCQDLGLLCGIGMPAICLLRCPAMGFLAFFTVVASNQISPQQPLAAFVFYERCKVNSFLCKRDAFAIFFLRNLLFLTIFHLYVL